jgi:Bacterial transcriptional repressor
LLTTRAIQVARGMAQHMVDAGVMVANPDEAAALAQQLVFTVTCWPTFARLQAGRNAQAASPGYAAYQVLTLLLPYVHGAGRGYIDYLRSKYPGGSAT